MEGRAFKFANNVNTDEIIPAKFLNTTDPKSLASHCMEGIRPDFIRKVRHGDIIIAGKNFGCGSSREHAPFSIKSAGVSCVIAESFARIFFRNSINIGLPILECPKAAKDIREGDRLRIDLKNGKIENLSTGKTYHAQRFPEFMERVINSGGLMSMVKANL